MRKMEAEGLEVWEHSQNRKCKEVLGTADWVSPQEPKKLISSEICLEWWDGNLDLNVEYWACMHRYTLKKCGFECIKVYKDKYIFIYTQ